MVLEAQTVLPQIPESMEELKTIKIDTSKRICKIAMKVWNGFAIVGFRLIDEEGQHLVDLNWSGVGNWAIQDIPEGNEIVGLKCNTQKYE